MNKFKFFFGVVIIFMLKSCSKKTIPANDCIEKAIKIDCICTKIYKPVCGCNGKTYGNECEARCQNITQFTEGECPK